MPSRTHRPQVRPQVRFEDPHTETRLRDTIQDLLRENSALEAKNHQQSKEIISLNTKNTYMRGTIDRLRGERNTALAWEESYCKGNQKLKEWAQSLEIGAGILEGRLRELEGSYKRLMRSGPSGRRPNPEGLHVTNSCPTWVYRPSPHASSYPDSTTYPKTAPVYST
ncbi:MAG: hypothetical protein Q9204_003564 [Flavoplaca sp. TL-2023a]